MGLRPEPNPRGGETGRADGNRCQPRGGDEGDEAGLQLLEAVGGEPGQIGQLQHAVLDLLVGLVRGLGCLGCGFRRGFVSLLRRALCAHDALLQLDEHGLGRFAREVRDRGELAAQAAQVGADRYETVSH
jgi:hypothetical protein